MQSIPAGVPRVPDIINIKDGIQQAIERVKKQNERLDRIRSHLYGSEPKNISGVQGRAAGGDQVDLKPAILVISGLLSDLHQEIGRVDDSISALEPLIA